MALSNDQIQWNEIVSTKREILKIKVENSKMGEELDVNMRCVQYMLFVSNFLFVMIALLLISIGTIIKAMYTDFEFFLESNYFSPSDLLIFCGFVIFFIAFFGCWGAMRESTLLVNLYAFFLLIILLLEITAAISALSMRFDLRSTITNNMNEVFKLVDNTTEAKTVFDFTQSQLMCCGVQGPADWKRVNKSNIYPQSCCTGYDFYGNNNFTCPDHYGGHHVYGTPCANQVTELVSQTSFLLTTGAICVAFIQFQYQYYHQQDKTEINIRSTIIEQGRHTGWATVDGLLHRTIIGIIFARLLSKTIRNLKTQRLVEAELRRQQIYSQIILGTTLDGECKEVPHTTSASEA